MEKFMLNQLQSVVEFPNHNHCIYRDGYVFTSIMNPANVLDAIVIRNPENCDCWSPKKSISQRTLGEHIDFIRTHGIEKAFIIGDDIEFLGECPSLKYISVIPANTARNYFDYQPLYRLPEMLYLSCATQYGSRREEKSTVIDYSNFPKLKTVCAAGKGHLHLGAVSTLEELYLSQGTNADLRFLHGAANLKRLWLTSCQITNLSGMEALCGLQDLALFHCRKLMDISQLVAARKTLQALDVSNCPKVRDFSAITDLQSLEYLILEGRNELDNVYFLQNLEHLRFFSFSFGIQNGDLTPCMKIPYVDMRRGRKHYNVPKRDLSNSPGLMPFVLL